MISHEIRLSWKSLFESVKEIFVSVGLCAEDAHKVADVLIWANLRGTDSHGVQLIPWYVEAVDLGHMKIKPNVRIEKETPSALLIEADNAFGAVVTTYAMKKVMEKAKTAGIAWAFIRKHNHQGAMGYYTRMAAERDLAGFAWVCGNATTAIFGAKFPAIANNPITISVPAKRHRPLILDMALSNAAGAKLILAKEKGIPIPADWALDEDGNPTTDPSKARFLAPLGGPKGSGLSLMLECLGSVLIGFPKVEPVVTRKEPPFGLGSPAGNPARIKGHLQNSVFIVIDISQFSDLDVYKEHIDTMIDAIKTLPKAEGVAEILLPGEPEWRVMDDRKEHGIPIPEKTYQNLKKVADRFKVSLPAGL